MRRFKVSGMTCSSCAMAIERAIWSADKGALVDVDVPKGEVAVETQADTQALVAAIRAAGFGIERVII